MRRRSRFIRIFTKIVCIRRRNLLLLYIGVFTCFLLLLFTCISNSIHSSLEHLDAVSKSLVWLKTHSNISEIIKLDRNTCIVCSNRVCQNNANIDVIYFVSSIPQNQQQRNAIRKTWGKDLAYRPIFITGTVDNTEIMDLAIDEAINNGDMIIENFVDSYMNLTIKTGFILKHYLKLCPQSVYLMKVDDETFVNHKLILGAIRRAMFHSKPVIGIINEPSRPFRSPKHKSFLSFELYNYALLPRYATGFGYLLPGNKIESMLINSINTPIINLEDVYWTGIIAQNERIPLKSDEHFKGYMPIIHYHCIYRRLAIVGEVSPKDMLKIWKNLHETNPDNCYGIIGRAVKYFLGFKDATL